MIVLGIDPGYGTCGYGAVEYEKGKFRPLGYGVITTAPGQPFHIRLAEIYHDMIDVIDHYKPDSVAIEALFFNSNTTTAIDVAQARGVILLACAHRGLSPTQYTPLQVKQAVVGYGRAEKKQVMEMTRIMLGLEKIPRPDDAADALAIAVCHAHSGSSVLRKG